MAISFKVTGNKSRKVVTRGFDVTRVVVKYPSPAAWNKYMHECEEKKVAPTDVSRMFETREVVVDGKLSEADALMYVTFERVRLLDGQMPTEIVSVSADKEYYEISAEAFRKYGRRISKKEAEAAEESETE